MGVLYFLAGLRNSVLTAFFSVLTYLGSEMTAVAVPMIVYWCFSKRRAYFLTANVALGSAVCQGLKFLCKVPRPFVRDPKFEIVESARADAGGYSFPSGHTESAASLFGSLALILRNRGARIVCVAFIVLVGFARMYLGVHYPTDVLGGLLIGLALMAALYPAYKASEKNPKVFPVLFGAAAACSLIGALLIEFGSRGAEEDPANWAEAVKNLNLLAGCMAAFSISIPVERKYIRFQTKAVWWVQVLKAGLGLSLAMGLRLGLKPLFAALLGDLGIASFLRYFLMTLFCLLVWPMAFPILNRLGRRRGEGAA